MAFYENVFIARPDLSPQQVENLVTAFSDIVKTNGGSVLKHENWGLRSLTYKIKKNKKGHYVLLYVDGTGQALTELERNQRINEDVLRYLSVKVEAIEEGPSAMLQSRNREDGEPRPEGRGERRDGRDGRSRRPRADADAAEGE